MGTILSSSDSRNIPNPKHVCNILCRDGKHCGIHYSTAPLACLEDFASGAVEWEVVEFWPATEAPPVSVYHPDSTFKQSDDARFRYAYVTIVQRLTEAVSDGT